MMMTACESESGKSNYRANNPNLREVKVKEVIQTSSYTYLNLQEEEDVYWGAIPRRDDIEVGDIYYFDSFMEMNDFQSKELDKTFKSIYFIQEVSSEPFPSADMIEQKTKGSSTVGNQEITTLEPVVGGITIKELYSNKEAYSGKTVKIKGHVVKYTEAVMGKNWLHIQDGTTFGNDFDLTVTTTGSCKINDVVVIEGKIVLNQDFGYGYSYAVLLEDAVILESQEAASLQ